MSAPPTAELTDPTTGSVVGFNSFAKTHVPAVAAQATATQAPAGVEVRNVCKSITVTIACGATAQTPILIYLRDGATGAGSILWSAALAAPVNGSASIQMTALDIAGSPNTAMTLEFAGAGVAASQETVSFNGYVAEQ